MTDKIIPAHGRSGFEIDQIALNIIKQYQPLILESPQAFDVELFFEHDLEDRSGLEASYADLPFGIYGMTDSENREVCVSKALMDSPHKIAFARSTIGHECGHVLIHVPEFTKRKAVLRSVQDKKDVDLAMYRKEDIPTYQNPEWQAHHFSGALLMPAATVKMALKDNATVQELAEIYQVTVPFVKARLRALDIRKQKGGRHGSVRPPFTF